MAAGRIGRAAGIPFLSAVLVCLQKEKEKFRKRARSGSGAYNRRHGRDAGASGRLAGALWFPGCGGHYIYSYRKTDHTGGRGDT